VNETPSLPVLVEAKPATVKPVPSAPIKAAADPIAIAATKRPRFGIPHILRFPKLAAESRPDTKQGPSRGASSDLTRPVGQRLAI